MKSEIRRKAGNGEGSVFARVKRGKTVWIAQVSAGRKQNGKRQFITKQFQTESAARRGLRSMLVERDKGTLMPNSQHTVASYAMYWVREVKPLEIRKTTASGYEDLLRRYVIPVLGTKRMADLRPGDIQSLMGNMRSSGYAVDTVNQVRRILSGMCRHAWRCGVLGANPVLATDPLHKQAGDKTQVCQPWTEEETFRAIEAFETHDLLGCFIRLMTGLGLRPGEALGIRWEDVELEMRQIAITGTLKEARHHIPNGEGVVRQVRNEPKTKSSYRVLNISEDLLCALEQQRLRQDMWQIMNGERWQDSGYVITSQMGTPLWASNVRKMFRKECQKSGIREIRLHDIRHVVARLALSNDIPLEQISQALGHTRIDTTKQIYAGSIQRLNDQFTAGMANILERRRKPTHSYATSPIVK